MSKKNNNKLGSNNNSYSNFDIPTHNYLEHYNLNDHGDIEMLLEILQHDFENGLFLTWEAVERDEQGLKLTDKQQEALDNLFSFEDEYDDRILYIDEIPRPSEPWYEIVKKITEHLLVDKFKTYDTHFAVTTEGWPELSDMIKEYGSDLSLPAGIKFPIDVIPIETKHKLWLQWCFVELEGIGQDEKITLEENEEHDRIERFIDCIKECKESVQFLGLSVNIILNTLILPQKDKNIFIELMIEKLGLTSSDDLIVEFLG